MPSKAVKGKERCKRVYGRAAHEFVGVQFRPGRTFSLLYGCDKLYCLGRPTITYGLGNVNVLLVLLERSIFDGRTGLQGENDQALFGPVSFMA